MLACFTKFENARGQIFGGQNIILSHHVSEQLVHIVALPQSLIRISWNYRIWDYQKRPMADSHFSERRDPGNEVDIGEDVICNLIHV